MITQLDGWDLEAQWLLKMDFLWLQNLTIMNDCCNIIKKHKDIDINLSKVDVDDQKVYENIFQSWKTTNVFQFESAWMKKYLKWLKPTNLDDLIAMVSLYRPWPIKFIQTYINRKHGIEPVIHPDPVLEPIMGKTYGICVTWDSKILFENGEYTKIEDIVNNNVNINKKVLSLNSTTWKIEWNNITHVFNNWKKTFYKTFFSDNTYIKTTLDHKFMVYRNNKIEKVKLKDIKKTDFIINISWNDINNTNKTYSEDKLLIIAYLIGDGYLWYQANISFINKDEKLLHNFKKSVLNSFPNSNFSESIRNNKVKTIVVNDIINRNNINKSTTLLTYLREIGLKQHNYKDKGLTSATKYIPEFIFNLSNNQIGYFIAKLWDCDGGISLKGYPYYATISEQLANDMVLLLNKIWVKAYITKDKPYMTKKWLHQKHIVLVSNRVWFYENVGIYISSDEKFKRITEKHNNSRVISKDKHIPHSIIQLLLNKYYKGVSIQSIDKNKYLSNLLKWYKNSDYINIESFNELFTRWIFDKVILDKEKELISFINNIHFTQIKSSENIWQHIAYDIEVENNHNYFVWKVGVSNCVYQEQIMKMAQDLAGYSLWEADLLRRAVWKKKKKIILEQREIFVKKSVALNHDEEIVGKIYDDMILPAAEYSFNKCLTKNAKILLYNWEYKSIENLLQDWYKWTKLQSLNTENNIFEKDIIIDIHKNGIKKVYQITLQNWLTLKSTDNHNFLTLNWWKELKEIGEWWKIAIPKNIDIVNNIEDNVYYEEIKSIEYIWEEETFDLEIAKNHNFIANWIITHNSHAACYAYIAYQWAFLKTYYPAEYMVAILMTQWDDLERTVIAIEDALLEWIEVVPLDVNVSDVEYKYINDKKIKMWLKIIKWCWEADMQKIVDEREQNWKYTDFDEFLQRNKQSMNKKILEWLLMVWALDALIDQNTWLHNVKRILAFLKKDKKNPSNQVNLFSMFDWVWIESGWEEGSTMIELDTPANPTNPIFKSMNEFVKTWFMLKNHPFDWIKSFIEAFEINRDTLKWNKNSSLLHKDKLEIRGVAIITDLKVKKTKGWKTITKMKLLWTDYYIWAIMWADLTHKFEYELLGKSKDKPAGLFKMIEFTWKYSLNDYGRGLFISDITFKDINQAYKVAEAQSQYHPEVKCSWDEIIAYKNEVLDYHKSASVLISDFLLKPENAELYKEKITALKEFLLRHHSLNWEYNILLKTFDWKVKDTELYINNKDALINYCEKISWFKVVWVKKSWEEDSK